MAHGSADHAHAAHADHAGQDEPQDPVNFWERRYSERDAIWSGRVNRVLEQVVAELPPGRALDLGCGEGGDAVWLAGRGWQVTGLDISATATTRATAAAATAGLADRTRFETADLSDPATWAGLDGTAFDLVSGCFLQSPLEFPRHDVLRSAAALLAPGGLLLVVAHAAPPPWSDVDASVHPELFPQPGDDVSALAVPAAGWDVKVAEVRRREATGPDGQVGHLDDSVVLLRRR